MKKEIAAVVMLLKKFIKKAEKLEAERVEKFVERLTVVLEEKYKDHWYPENPSKGQAFRCIRVNKFQQEDPELQRACNESGVQYKDLGLPRELTLWVDPGEVCCRYGEKNFAFTVATFSGDDKDKEDVTRKETNTKKELNTAEKVTVTQKEANTKKEANTAEKVTVTQKEASTKKEANTAEKVTSDYHSGSSSDEEGNPKLSCVPGCLLQIQPFYQVMYPGVAVWASSSKKKSKPGKAQGIPYQVYRYRPQGKPSQHLRHSGWTQLVPRSVQYWGSTSGLIYC